MLLTNPINAIELPFSRKTLIVAESGFLFETGNYCDLAKMEIFEK